MALYAIVGAGNGGQALSAILKMQGHEVRLWNRSRDKVKLLNERGSLLLQGKVSGEVKLNLITTNMEAAIRGAEIIFIVLPANAHREMALKMSSIVEKEQAVILNPGRTGGVLEFKQGLAEGGTRSLPLIMETQSLFCACRAHSFGIVDILSFKSENTISGMPKSRIADFWPQLKSIYVKLKIADTTLMTGLDNIGAILHPTPVPLNSGWIESRDIFFPHYYHGISPTIAAFVEKIDEERLSVAKKFGIDTRSVKQWHKDIYGYEGNNLYKTLQGNSAYASIDAPRSLNTRYLTEDIPTGLVPISELGRAADVKTPLIDMIIELGSTLLEIDFRKEGRNLRRLGLEGKSINEIKQSFE